MSYFWMAEVALESRDFSPRFVPHSMLCQGLYDLYHGIMQAAWRPLLARDSDLTEPESDGRVHGRLRLRRFVGLMLC